MKIQEYRNFELEATDVKKDGAGVIHFTVRVLSSDAGEGKPIPRQIPPELNDKLRQLERRKLSWAAIIEVGEQLADLLLPEEARDLFERSRELLEDGQGLRLQLRLDPPLAPLPWELVYIQRAGGEKDCSGFLALFDDISITRYEPMAISIKRGPKPRRRRILAALSCPNDPGLTPLDLTRELENLEAAVGAVSGIDLDVIENPTGRGLRRGLRGRVDIFHFAGHGGFTTTGLGETVGSAVGEGEIVLAGKGGRTARMSAEDLAISLGGKRLRLVVLGGCETGRHDGLNLWSGFPPALMKAGIPAVVAMQYTIWDEAAAEFDRVLYEELAAGAPLDQAVTWARKEVFDLCNSIKDDPELSKYWQDWAAPVFYLRGKEDPFGTGENDSGVENGPRNGTRRAILSFILPLGSAIIGIAFQKIVNADFWFAVVIFVALVIMGGVVYFILGGRRLDISEHRRPLRVFGVTAGVIVVSTLALTLEVCWVFDNILLGEYNRLNPTLISDEVRIVSLDNYSAREYLPGKKDFGGVDPGDLVTFRPWHGRVARILSESGAKAVGIDVSFIKDERAAKEIKDYDAYFVDEIGKAKSSGARIVIGREGVYDKATKTREELKVDEVIMNVADEEGHVYRPEWRGVTRAAEYAYARPETYGEEYRPIAAKSFPLVLFEAFRDEGAGVGTNIIGDDLLVYVEECGGLGGTEYEIPLCEGGYTYIPFPPKAFENRTHTYAQVIATYDCENPKQENGEPRDGMDEEVDEGLILDQELNAVFGGKCVILGITAGEKGKEDSATLPGGREVHGSEFLGYALSALIQDDFVKPVPLFINLLVLLGLILIVFIAVNVEGLGAVGRASSLVILGLLLWGVSILLYWCLDLIWFNPIYPTFAVAFSAAVFLTAKRRGWFKPSG